MKEFHDSLLKGTLSADIERLKQTLKFDELPEEVNDELASKIDYLQKLQEILVK